MVLRGLAVSGLGAQIGLNFQNGASLSIENCIFDGFIDTGIELFREGTAAQMRIDHTTVRNCGTGISAGTIAVGLARVTITHSSSSENSVAALNVGDNGRGVATDCVFANSQIGVIAEAAFDGDPSQVSLERCTISGNTTGVQAGSGASAVLRGTVRIAHNQITANTLGVSQQTDGVIMTMTSGGCGHEHDRGQRDRRHVHGQLHGDVANSMRFSPIFSS